MTTQDDNWPGRLDAAIKARFGRETETFYDLFGSMRYVTAPADDVPLSDEIHEFIREWMDEHRPAA